MLLSWVKKWQDVGMKARISDNSTLKMQYRIVDGRNVCENGEVIINHTRHIVQAGYVKCNSSLNGSAWNTTNEQSLCPICYNKPVQLEFNF